MHGRRTQSAPGHRLRIQEGAEAERGVAAVAGLSTTVSPQGNGRGVYAWRPPTLIFCWIRRKTSSTRFESPIRCRYGLYRVYGKNGETKSMEARSMSRDDCCSSTTKHVSRNLERV